MLAHLGWSDHYNGLADNDGCSGPLSGCREIPVGEALLENDPIVAPKSLGSNGNTQLLPEGRARRNCAQDLVIVWLLPANQ